MALACVLFVSLRTQLWWAGIKVIYLAIAFCRTMLVAFPSSLVSDLLF